ncbi:turripeptide Lol9.1-like [Montipora foliosa]|uniref:turripeptide Lol9.1-like n=1 Tax=Montipora foliosa TaxID=591990 RepID=UPI0035F1B760
MKINKMLVIGWVSVLTLVIFVVLSSLTNCPEKCELLYDPVCGSNGRTYKTTCHLERDNCFGRKEKVLVVHKGECLAKEEDEAEAYKSFKCMRIGRGKYLNC